MAHRAFCAAAIFFRPAAEIVLFLRVGVVPFTYTLPKAVSAAVTRCNSSASRVRSFCSWVTTDCMSVLGMWSWYHWIDRTDRDGSGSSFRHGETESRRKSVAVRPSFLIPYGHVWACFFLFFAKFSQTGSVGVGIPALGRASDFVVKPPWRPVSLHPVDSVPTIKFEIVSHLPLQFASLNI